MKNDSIQSIKKSIVEINFVVKLINSVGKEREETLNNNFYSVKHAIIQHGRLSPPVIKQMTAHKA
jgi:hypothetical protein